MSILELPPPSKRRRTKQTRMRDQRAERAAKRLRENSLFANLPAQLLKGYASLYVLSAEVRAKLNERGLIRPDGSFDPGIDMFRRLKDSEARYLGIMLEVAGREKAEPKPVLDLEELRDEEKPDEK
jgi:hypothetical protein